MAKREKKLVYNYSPITFEYLYSEEARESPRELGVFLIPGNATDKEPPKTKKHQCAVFDERTDRWSIVEDYRNTPIYSKETGEEVIYDKLGSIPAGYVLKKKPGAAYKWDDEKGKWVKDSLLEVKLNVQKEINLINENKSKIINFKSRGFRVTAEFLAELNTAIILGEDSLGVNFKLLDKDNNLVNFEYSDLVELAKTIQIRNQKLLSAFEAKKRKMEA